MSRQDQGTITPEANYIRDPKGWELSAPKWSETNKPTFSLITSDLVETINENVFVYYKIW